MTSPVTWRAPPGFRPRTRRRRTAVLNTLGWYCAGHMNRLAVLVERPLSTDSGRLPSSKFHQCAVSRLLQGSPDPRMKIWCSRPATYPQLALVDIVDRSKRSFCRWFRQSIATTACSVRIPEFAVTRVPHCCESIQANRIPVYVRDSAPRRFRGEIQFNVAFEYTLGQNWSMCVLFVRSPK